MTLARWACVALALAGCTNASHGGPCRDTPIQSSLVRTLRFARQDPRGVSEGFDIDRHVSLSGDPIGCRHADFTSPEGVPGIDNQIATLVPLIESQAGGVTLDSILTTAINDGQLLLAIELLGVDDPLNDDCVTVRTRPLIGTPSLGTDHLVEIGQTFDAAPNGEETLVPNARIVNGVVDIGPVPLTVPVAILDARFTLHIQSGFMHIELHDDGVWSGKLAGGISISEMTMIAQGLNIPPDLMNAVMLLLASSADLGMDATTGRCTQVSSTLLFESVTAFVYDDGVDAGYVDAGRDANVHEASVGDAAMSTMDAPMASDAATSSDATMSTDTAFDAGM
jgi:hypothetical protein